MRKRSIANGIMVAVIAVIFAAGIFAVGFVQGWFDRPEEGRSARLGQLRGIVSIQRNGVAYTPEADTALRTGDRLTTAPTATAVIRVGGSTFTLNQNTEVEIVDPDIRSFSLRVSTGEVFVLADSGAPVTLLFSEQRIPFSEGAAFLSVRAGAQDLSVYAGKLTAGETCAEAGQRLSWVDGEAAVLPCSAKSLNDFCIRQIRAANQKYALCFTDQDLDRVLADRAEELEAQKPTQPTTPPESQSQSLTCTLTVRCDTILDNWDALDPAKAGYVPESGYILQTKVVFTQGETAFDVLKRACDQAGIALEYSWTPIYNSYYVEGIHNIYEFDCGSESGWMYQVNGWYPNYGCSSYRLADGDQVVFAYTCTGLGTDLGASVG